ncbi:hypothetical protein QJQ45_021775, partial [Haematococcus lacustris]
GRNAQLRQPEQTVTWAWVGRGIVEGQGERRARCLGQAPDQTSTPVGADIAQGTKSSLTSQVDSVGEAAGMSAPQSRALRRGFAKCWSTLNASFCNEAPAALLMNQGVGSSWVCLRRAGSRSLHFPPLAPVPGALTLACSLVHSLRAPPPALPDLRRQLTSSIHQLQEKQVQQQAPTDSFELTTERISALTDKIPQRPVGVVEGTSYSIIILAAFGVLAYLVYMFVLNFIMEPTALQCFNHTLDVLKADPRITVRLGASDDIRAWGSNSSSRVARQQIPHQIYKDAQGQEHVRVQFYMKGPSGTGLVNADMYRDTAGQWQYTYLLMDVYTASSSNPSRLYIVKPQ